MTRRTNEPAVEPLRAEDYGERMARRRQAGASPTDVDWLLNRHLERDLADAGRRYARGTLLDVGCGGRPYEAQLAGRIERYVGLDTPASPLSLPDVWGTAAKLPFAARSFDTVLCSQVLEHVAEPWSCVEEMARVLRPGGHLLMSAPQTFNLHEEPYDFFRFTRFGLTHLCTRAGLEVIELRSEGGPWAVIGLSLTVHLGSYARAAASRLAPRRKSGAPPPRSDAWQRWLAPLRLPMAVTNAAFAALDALPHPGILAVNHLAVARKPGGAAP